MLETGCHLPHKVVDLEDYFIHKFKIGFQIEASEVLKSLRVVRIFEIGEMSDVVEAVRDHVTDVVSAPLCVDTIWHNAFVEVNEVELRLRL